jgi:hypothetical protein
MAVDDILQDLLANPLPENKTQPAMNTDLLASGETSASGPDKLVRALERQCSAQYTDPGPGIHFIGLLLAVFAAEIVSGYWAKNAQTIQGSERDPARLISCLYSGKEAAFVLAHPTEVVSQFKHTLNVDADKAGR